MTQVPGPHLSPDDVESWLSGTLDAERTRHLDLCPECFDRAQVEREIVEQLSALPLLLPSAGFADRVMASVTVPIPSRSARSPGTQRIFATRRADVSRPVLVRRLDGREHRVDARPTRMSSPRSATGSWRRAPRPAGSRSAASPPTSSNSRGTRARGPSPARPAAWPPPSAWRPWPTWAASSRCAACWLCRPSRWPMSGSGAAGRRGSGAGRHLAMSSVLVGTLVLVHSVSSAAAERTRVRCRPAPQRSSWSGTSGISSPASRAPTGRTARRRKPFPPPPKAPRRSTCSDLSNPVEIEAASRPPLRPRTAPCGSPCRAAPRGWAASSSARPKRWRAICS